MEGKDRKIIGVNAVIRGLSDEREKWYEFIIIFKNSEQMTLR